MRHRLLMLVLCALFAPLAAAQGLAVRDAWVRANPPGAPTAAYLTIANGSLRPERLVRVTSDAFKRVEIHATTHEKGVMSMRPVEVIEVPANGEVALAPGGLHVMLYDATRPYQAGDTVTLELRFEGGERLRVAAAVRAAASEHHRH